MSKDWQVAFAQLPIFFAITENLDFNETFSLLITCKSTLVHRQHFTGVLAKKRYDCLLFQQ
jgi:hypothetical protein